MKWLHLWLPSPKCATWKVWGVQTEKDNKMSLRAMSLEPCPFLQTASSVQQEEILRDTGPTHANQSTCSLKCSASQHYSSEHNSSKNDILKTKWVDHAGIYLNLPQPDLPQLDMWPDCTELHKDMRIVRNVRTKQTLESCWAPHSISPDLLLEPACFRECRLHSGSPLVFSFSQCLKTWLMSKQKIKKDKQKVISTHTVHTLKYE